MSDTHGQDQFTTVANRRAGYTEPVEWALKIARKGGTLAAGEGLLIVAHYEAQLAQLREQVDGMRFLASGWKRSARLYRKMAVRLARGRHPLSALGWVD